MFENNKNRAPKIIEKAPTKKITSEDLENLLKPIPSQIQESALFRTALAYLASNSQSLDEILNSMNGVIQVEKLAPTLKEIAMDKTTKMFIDYNLEELQRNQIMMGHVDLYLTATADFYQQA